MLRSPPPQLFWSQIFRSPLKLKGRGGGLLSWLSLYLLHKVSCLILFPHKNIFWNCFSSSITEFGILVNKAKYTIFEMTKDLKTVIFASKVSFLIPHSLTALTRFLIQSRKFKSSCTPKIYMVSLVRSTIFIPQSAKLTFFSMSIPAILHLLN